jgi:DNA helicase-2/ATP-dependent DNA helicase PcrA
MGLTKKQKEAVEAIPGHFVILAGPGCGKTHTITEKIMYIFKKEIIPEPYGILAVTFTDSAARIMRSRLRKKGFDKWDRIWVGTFHAFGRYVLSCYGGEIGIREDFEVADPEKRNEILKKLIVKYKPDFSLSDLGNYFDFLKRKGVYKDDEGVKIVSDARDAYIEYNDILRKSNLLDFGDLVALTVKLLNSSDFVKRLYARFFRYVLVDEFQDTDGQQLEMIKILAENAIGSTIVGDDDQSIFGWRGALRRNVHKIKDLLGSTEIVLGENFRSDMVIVEAAEKVIGEDPDRLKKSIKAVSEKRGNLYFCKFDTPIDEANKVVEWIKDLNQKSKVEDLGEISIIARTHFRSKWAIEEMDKNDIPWFDRSRLNFQDSWETTLALSVIQLASNPNSSHFLYHVLSAVEDGGLAYRLGDTDAMDIAKQIRDKLKSSRELELSLDQIDKIFEIAGIEKIIKDTSPGESITRQKIKNLDQMKNDIIEEAKRNNIDLLQAVDRFMCHDAVQVISGHQSKGCEFDYVFFIGLEDNILPDYRSHKSDSKLAEERRIFYVGLTRARKAAYLTCVKNLPITKDWTKQTKPSRFIGHIPAEYFSDIT